MKLHFVSRHLPEAEGTAAGRILLATVEGLLAEGHEIDVWSWGPNAPGGILPAWCRWDPLPPESRLRSRVWSLRRPRDEVARGVWRPPLDAIAVADDPLSFGAVRRSERSVVTMHFLTSLDATALRRRAAKDVQDRRVERRVVREAGLALAYSERLVDVLGRGTFVPAAFPLPDHPVTPNPEPVAVFLGDLAWTPNQAAVADLLACWPAVRRRVPEARLILAGRGMPELRSDPSAGVEAIGEVERSADALGRGAVFAFPCPGTSGPKVKVMEALAHGLPVVTTPAGVEGLLVEPDRDVVVTEANDFADALASLLLDEGRRTSLGAAGRAAMEASHAPVPAARARVDALAAAFG